MVDECGANVNMKVTKNFTPMQQAAIQGDLKTVRFLVERGADKNAVCELGYSPFLRACQHGKSDVDLYLLAQGVGDIEIEDKITKETPIFLAIRHEDLKLLNRLLDLGANKEKTNADGITPLAYSLYTGFYDCAMLLIAQEANAKVGSIFGRPVRLIIENSEFSPVQKNNLLGAIYGFHPSLAKKAMDFHSLNPGKYEFQKILDAAFIFYTTIQQMSNVDTAMMCVRASVDECDSKLQSFLVENFSVRRRAVSSARSAAGGGESKMADDEAPPMPAAVAAAPAPAPAEEAVDLSYVRRFTGSTSDVAEKSAGK